MKRLLAVLAVTVSLAVPLPASAAAPALVVSAPSGRHGYLDVDHPRLLDVNHLSAWSRGRPAALEILSTDPQGPFVYVVVVWLPGLLSSPAVLGTTRQLDAGRYRVRVLSDGPVTFSVGLAPDGPDDAGIRVRPASPLRVTTRVAGPATTDVGPQRQALRAARAVPRGTNALLVTFLSGTFTGLAQSCATATPSCSQVASPVDPGSSYPVLTTDPSVTSTVAYAPDASHVRDARFTLDGASAVAGRFAGVSFAFAP